ncbi:acyl-CoA dehydrogenase family protein [soil metagenome]
MNVDYDDDTRTLMEHARRLLADRGATGLARHVLDTEGLTHAAELWTEIGVQGWCGAQIDPGNGGLGMGTPALCGLAEEIGRSLAPVPFASSAYGFSQALSIAGTPAQRAYLLPQIASGAMVGTLALFEHSGAPFTGPLDARAEDGRLSGTKIPVVDGSIADLAVVLAATAEGPTLFVADLAEDSVRRTMISTLDPTRDAARLTFDNTPVELLGRPGEGYATAGAILERYAVPLAFEQIGGADRCLEMAVALAKTRYAFGRPIGGYQAIKHRLADMYVQNETARSVAYYAAWAADHDPAAFPAAAAAARIAASEAHWFAARESIQVHGGIGFTWEMDCHLHYRRARHLGAIAGSPGWWKARLASILRKDAA